MNNMKSLKSLLIIKRLKRIALLLFVVILCGACSEEEFNGQFPVKKTTPSPVTVLPDGVVNFAGGAAITYQLPDETDLLYVKAVCQKPDGSVLEERASVFSNTLTLKGFGRSTTAKVKLITVDRNRNESIPVEVDIHPDDSPIYEIFESLQVRESFGGMVVRWDNPLKESIVVSVSRRNVENEYENIETFYSAAEAAGYSVRGQDAVKSDFAFSIRDVYHNYTDTKELSITPFYEELLDKNKFIPVAASSKFVLSIWGSTDMSILWNGNLIRADLTNLYQMNNPNANAAIGESGCYFAINLGVKAKLSRFRYWGRNDYFFRLSNARFIQMYGTNDPAVGTNPESDNSQWILLNPEMFVSFRPSGLDSSVAATDEDYAYAMEGEEFEFPLESPAVQWVRFYCVENWTGSNGLNCVEIRFWGDPNVE
jgi:hypothetical protein